MNNAFAVLLVVKGAQAWQKSQKESQHRARSHSGDYGCGHGRRRRCAYSRIAGKTRNRLRRNSYNLRQAILAVEHVADRPHAHRAHRLSAIAAKTCGVRLRMDRTLHGILLEPASPPIVHGAATKGISSASTSRRLITSFARFCCLGAEGVLWVLPGCLSGEDCGTVLSFEVGISLSCRRRD